MSILNSRCSGVGEAGVVACPGGSADRMSDEWQLVLPDEDDHDAVMLNRLLEARTTEGEIRTRWRYNGNSWTVIEGQEPSPNPSMALGCGVLGFGDMFYEIVGAVIGGGLRLFSVPDPERRTVEP